MNTRFSAHSPAQAATDHADCPFFRRYGQHLPRGLRESARGLSWERFHDTYAPRTRPAALRCRRLPGGDSTVDAILRTDGGARSGTGSGPIGAATELLHSAGRRVEVLEFHQLRVAEGVATLLRTGTSLDSAGRWTFTLAQDSAESAVRALIGSTR